MAWKILITAPYLIPVIDRFRPLFEEKGAELIIPNVVERMEEDDLLPLIGNIDGVIAGDDRFTERVIAAAPKLKVLSKWGTGVDSFDHNACKQRGIAICNTPNAFSEPVADSILGYMLAFARNIAYLDNNMKSGKWQKIPGKSLQECTLGVIGVGNVGKAVIRRAHAFDMRILGTDPIILPADWLAQYGVEMVAQEELLRQSDFVTLNCDLNPTSRHLMNEAAFKQMKPDAVVINTARGPIIDEKALIAALQNRQIGGAGLDVFEHEPLPVDSPLRQMNNVFLAPHNSNSSPEAWEHVHHNTIKNLLDVLKASETA